LERPEFYRLYAYFIEESRIHRDRTYRQDFFTEAADGRLLPKHPVIISVMAAPFYGWMGQVGFWVFQQLVLLALIISLYRVARDLAGPEAALLTCALAAAGTNLVWYYSYNFSYDILGTMFIMAGLSYLKRYPLLAGTLFALSLYVRAANVVVLPFLVLAGCSMIVLFFCYSGWLKAHGDRYVLPAAFLMLIPTALVFRRLSNALQSRLKKG